MTVQLVSDKKIASTSSKGNQEKWYDAESDCWFKLDQFGYEALAETLVAVLLENSNIESCFPFRFVRYQIEKVLAHGHERTACASPNFLKPGQSVITLSHLFRQETGKPLSVALKKLPSDKKRIQWLGLQTAEMTGLKLFPQYLAMLMEVDALFLNEDRHLNNIAVLSQGDRFDYCPVFDNGAALLSNMQIYRPDIDPTAHIKQLRACPFNTTFNRQVLAARALFGQQLRIRPYTRADLVYEMQPLLLYYARRDRGVITDRVCTCILTRQKAMNLN